MTCVRSLSITVLAMGAVEAQTVALSTLIPATAQATLNGQTVATNLPAGPVANSGSLLAMSSGPQGEFVYAEAGWSLFNTAYGVYSSFSQRSLTLSPTPASAGLTPCDFLMQMSNPSPVAAQVRLTRSFTPPAGTATRILQVDIGNDGTIEFSESSINQTITLPVTIGPVPLQVRIHNQLSLPGPGLMIDMSMQVDVEPTAGITATPLTVGCDAGHSQALLPTFAGDLIVRMIGPLHSSNPAVSVFGFSAQPVPLPTTQPLTCVLLPSPDVLIFMPLAPNPFVVPLPPAVRPVTFFTQAVVLDPAGLTTTNGVRIDAF